jgi:hypothetical protein
MTPKKNVFLVVPTVLTVLKLKTKLNVELVLINSTSMPPRPVKHVPLTVKLALKTNVLLVYLDSWSEKKDLPKINVLPVLPIVMPVLMPKNVPKVNVKKLSSNKPMEPVLPPKNLLTVNLTNISTTPPVPLVEKIA